MEKCRDVTQGYTTQKECDKWPQQVCNLEKKTVKKYSPETQVRRLILRILDTYSNNIYRPTFCFWKKYNVITFESCLSARNFLANYVDQVHVPLLPVPKNAERKWKQLYKKFQKKDALFEPNHTVNSKQNWCQCKL